MTVLYLMSLVGDRPHKAYSFRYFIGNSLRDCLNLIRFILEVIQPFQGCCFIDLIFRGLTPTVIQIKSFQDFHRTKVRPENSGESE